MGDRNISKLLFFKGRRKYLLAGGIIRICLIVIIWLIIAVPKKVFWSINDDSLTHISFSIILSWNILAFLGYYFKKTQTAKTLLTVILFDLMAITLLVAYTGGATSPFTVLYLFEIIGAFYMGNFWQGFLVSITGGLLFLLLSLAVAFGFFQPIIAFGGDLDNYNNPILAFTTLFLIILLMGYTTILNALMSYQKKIIEDELDEYGSLAIQVKNLWQAFMILNPCPKD